MSITIKAFEDLTTLTNMAFIRGVGESTPTWKSIAREIPSTTTTSLYPFMGDFPDLEEIKGAWVKKQIELTNYRLSNRKFGVIIEEESDAIDDEKFSAFLEIARNWGVAGGMHTDKMVWHMLPGGLASTCYDGQPYFSATHPRLMGGATFTNIAVGGGSAAPWYMAHMAAGRRPIFFQNREVLSSRWKRPPATEGSVFYDEQVEFKIKYRGAFGYSYPEYCFISRETFSAANVKLVRLQMNTQVNSAGRKLSLAPTHLIVGPTNYDAAEELLHTKDFLSGGETNEMIGSLKLIKDSQVEDIDAANELAAENEN